MIPIQRIMLAVVSGIAGLAALYLIRSPGSLPHEKALQLGAVTLLIAATLFATLWDTLRLARPAPAAADIDGNVPLPETSVDPVQGEVSKLLSLLRQHAQALHSADDSTLEGINSWGDALMHALGASERP